jgi:hypothetical protein
VNDSNRPGRADQDARDAKRRLLFVPSAAALFADGLLRRRPSSRISHRRIAPRPICSGKSAGRAKSLSDIEPDA